jgi:hypothetical protein
LPRCAMPQCARCQSERRRAGVSVSTSCSWTRLGRTWLQGLTTGPCLLRSRCGVATGIACALAEVRLNPPLGRSCFAVITSRMPKASSSLGGHSCKMCLPSKSRESLALSTHARPSGRACCSVIHRSTPEQRKTRRACAGRVSCRAEVRSGRRPCSPGACTITPLYSAIPQSSTGGLPQARFPDAGL